MSLLIQFDCSREKISVLLLYENCAELLVSEVLCKLEQIQGLCWGIIAFCCGLKIGQKSWHLLFAAILFTDLHRDSFSYNKCFLQMMCVYCIALKENIEEPGEHNILKISPSEMEDMKTLKANETEE